MALSSRVAPSHALVEPLLVVDDDEEEEISKAYVYKLTRGLQWRGYAARLAPNVTAADGAAGTAWTCEHALRLKQLSWCLSVRAGGFDAPVLYTVAPKVALARTFTVYDGCGSEIATVRQPLCVTGIALEFDVKCSNDSGACLQLAWRGERRGGALRVADVELVNRAPVGGGRVLATLGRHLPALVKKLGAPPQQERRAVVLLPAPEVAASAAPKAATAAAAAAPSPPPPAQAAPPATGAAAKAAAAKAAANEKLDKAKQWLSAKQAALADKQAARAAAAPPPTAQQVRLGELEWSELEALLSSPGSAGELGVVVSTLFLLLELLESPAR